MMANGKGGGDVDSFLFACSLCDQQFLHYAEVVTHVSDVHKVADGAVNSVIRAPGPEGLKSYQCILCSELFAGKKVWCNIMQYTFTVNVIFLSRS